MQKVNLRTILIFAAIVSGTLLAAPVGHAAPAAPGHVLPRGYVPTYCAAGEGTTAYGVSYGYYYAGSAKGWVSTPWCLPRWGNLTMTASQVVAGGSTVSLSAIPDTNSSQYAPETGSITWSAGSKIISGCGARDLVCTAKIPAATEAWQWLEFKVSMPRIFFVDSPGSNCAGQHLCAGYTTYAWSVVGVAPKQALQIGKLVAEVPATATGPVQLTCGSGAPCEGSVKVTLPADTPSIYSEIIDSQNQKNAERWSELKDAHKSVNGFKNSIPIVDVKDAGQKINNANSFLKGSSSASHSANLQIADAALEQVFPAGSSSAAASAASYSYSTMARSAASDDAAAAFRALTKTSPSARDLTALRSFVARARSSAYSSDRARARIILALSLEAGRHVLRSDLRKYGKSVPLGSVTKRIAGGRKAKARVKLTLVGTKVQRFIQTVRGNSAVKAKLTVGNRQGGRTRSASASVRLF